MLKSLRSRLLAWQAAILTVVVFGFGGTLYYQIRQARFAEIDADLLSIARLMEGDLRGVPRHLLDGNEPPDHPPEPPPPRPDDFERPERFKEPPPEERPFPPPFGEPRRRPPPQGGRPDNPQGRPLDFPRNYEKRFGDKPEDAPYFVIWLSDGNTYKASAAPPGVTPVFTPEPLARGEPLRYQQHGEFREVIVSGPFRTQVLVGRRVHRDTEELTWLAGKLATTGLIVLFVGLMGSWLLSRRIVRPIAQMSAAAAAMSASNLSSRIAVEEVDSELGKLATILNDTFGRLEGAFERQTRFTADASHELRTPLAIIQSHAELALAKPRQAEEYQQALATCQRASQRMGAIIEGLLTLARADAGKLELKHRPFDLYELVSVTVELLEPLAARKQVTLSVQGEPLEIESDPTRLAQLVTNLTSNAIHYNRPGGTAAVTLTADEAYVELTVSDTGCGIPEADASHIFERFYRVDKARSRQRGGSGLGLAICRSIVEALGGTITFQSRLGVGTTFQVRLPRSIDMHAGIE